MVMTSLHLHSTSYYEVVSRTMFLFHKLICTVNGVAVPVVHAC